MKYTNNLKKCRTIRDYTQEEVAKGIGIKREAYSHYENGRNDVPTAVLIKLAAFYGCTTDELLGSEYYYKVMCK